MQDILKEYGPAFITVAAIIALVVLIRMLIGSGTDSLVGGAFKDLLDYFFSTLKTNNLSTPATNQAAETTGQIISSMLYFAA